MHYQYWPLSVTAPAGTPPSAPVMVNWPIPQGHLKQVQIDIPGGHSGLVGVRLVYHGTVIYPWTLNGYLIPVKSSYDVEWGDEIAAVGLQVQMYNTDIYPHTTYWRAEVWPVVGPAPGALRGAALVTAGSSQHLAAVAGLSSSGG